MKNLFEYIDGPSEDDPLSLFVGRNSELARLGKHFASGGCVASVSGSRGSGKTALAMMFASQVETVNMFPGGINILNTLDPFSFFTFLDNAGDFKFLKERSLYVLDNFYSQENKLEEILIRVLRRQPLLNFIFVGVRPYVLPTFNCPDLQLGGLTRQEFYELVTKLFKPADKKVIYKIYKIVAGSPLFANIAGMTARDGIITLRSLLTGFGEFEHPGILGPDGQPIVPGRVPEQIRVEVIEANANLFNKLRHDPAAMRSLAPRKFEEIVAELLEQQGYSVELTPYSSDGGFDMYVARKDNLGSFLYLVECKRYTPPNKVGIEIIRALHGVVQQQQANAGIVVTSSFFTKGAKEFQHKVPHQLHLRDYLAMQKWLGII